MPVWPSWGTSRRAGVLKWHLERESTKSPLVPSPTPTAPVQTHLASASPWLKGHTPALSSKARALARFRDTTFVGIYCTILGDYYLGCLPRELPQQDESRYRDDKALCLEGLLKPDANYLLEACCSSVPAGFPPDAGTGHQGGRRPWHSVTPCSTHGWLGARVPRSPQAPGRERYIGGKNRNGGQSWADGRRWRNGGAC